MHDREKFYANPKIIYPACMFKGRIKALKSEEDAFGQMIWAHYKGKEVFELWERNDGYISVAACMMHAVNMTCGEPFYNLET